MNSHNKTIFLILLFVVQSVPTFSNMSEFFTVFSMYLKKPHEVGEIIPLSRLVGKEISKHIVMLSLDATSPAKRYLEAGGGCGGISICIAQALRSCDHLDVAEINPEMCRMLKLRLQKYPNVTVHCCSILDWHPKYQYDAIVSTLPFLSLGIDFTKETMQCFQMVAAKNCMVSCVEFPIMVVFRKMVRNLRIKDADFTAVQRYMAQIRQKYLKESTTIYYNVPPINVYHLLFNV